MSRTRASEPLRWAGSIAGALAVHAAVGAAVLMDWAPAGSSEPDTRPIAAMMVELAPLPSAPDRPASQLPPGPEQVEQRVVPRSGRNPPAFDPPPEAKGVPPPDALPLKQEDAPESEQVAAADRTTAAPSSQAADAQALQAPIEGVPTDDGRDAIQTWEHALLSHLDRHKKYPAGARMRRQEDVIYLRFTMDRGGHVLTWNISRSRGYALLDAEVDALIERASPLPPPPGEMGGATVEMVVPVEFYLRRNLAQGGRG